MTVTETRPEEGAGVDDRTEASLAAAVWALSQGAAMVRVHDVRPTVEAVRLLDAVGSPA